MQSPGSTQQGELLRLNEIVAPRGLLPISRSTWFAWQKDKSRHMPRPIRLGPRVTAYRRTEIEAFIADPDSWGRASVPNKILRNAEGDR